MVENSVAIIVISCIVLAYLVALLWAYNKDKTDLSKISFIPLCGRDGAFKYEVIVVTGRYGGSGDCYFLWF